MTGNEFMYWLLVSVGVGGAFMIGSLLFVFVMMAQESAQESRKLKLKERKMALAEKALERAAQQPAVPNTDDAQPAPICGIQARRRA